MQGPRLASHHDGIELPDILPPKGKRAALRTKFARQPPPNEEGQGGATKEREELQGGKQDLEEGDDEDGGGLSWLQRQKKLFMRHLSFIGPGEPRSSSEGARWTRRAQLTHESLPRCTGIIASVAYIVSCSCWPPRSLVRPS